jgi:hypothetical protein
MAMNPRLLRPLASGAFSPKQIAGLALWLDAADSSTLYTTSEGPVAAVSSPLDIAGCVGWWDASDASTLTLDGSGNVEAWADKTSEGNDLTQATAANRPSVTAAAVNGLPAVTFDGSNDTLRTGAISLTQPFQYYLVFRFESAYTSGAPRIIDAGTQPSPGRAGEFFRQGANDARLYSGSTVVGSSVPAGQLEQFNLWSISSGGASDSFIRYKGGEYQVSTTAGTGAGSRITLGGDSNATASSHSNISVAELVLVSGALSAAERASLERYFAVKYGFDTVHAPATAASDPVGYWGDKSGNGRHATQTTANNRATYTTAGFGGKNCLTFDGSNASSRMVLGDLSAAFPTYGEVIIAYEAVSDTAYSLYTTKALQDALLFSGGHFIGTFVSTRFSPSPNAPKVPTNGSALVSMSSTGSTFVLRRNGTQDFSHTGSTFEAGTVHTLANRAEGEAGLAFNGKIGEVLLFNADMGNVNRAKVEGYLAWKWGLETQLPYDHPYARSFPGFGSQTTPSDSDTLTYLAAVKAADGTGVEVSVANAVDDFVKGCKSDGIWDAIKASCILAGARTLAGALVPLKGVAPTNNNFVSGDYNRETGLLGNVATKSLNSNRAGNADPQNSFHAAVYASTVASGGVRVYSGSGLNAAGAFNFFVDGGTAIIFRNRTSGLSSLAGGASATGLLGTSRGSSASYVSRAGGTSQTNTAASETPVSQNIFIYALNNSGASFHANARLAFYTIGESIDLALLDTRVSALIRALRPQAANADAQDWIDRVYANGGTVSTSTANAVSTFCDAIDAAGIRDRFYRMGIFAGSNLNAALVPLYRGPKRGDGRNLVTASQELSAAAWTKDSVSITADSLVAPDGTTTADVMTEDGTTNTHRVHQTVTATANTTLAVSCYVKRTSGTRNINLRAQAGADHMQATFDLSTGSATTAQGGTGSATSAVATADGDWWRLSLVGKPSTSTANPSLSIYLHNGSSTYYTGDASSAVAVWGVQVEYGTAATEYNGSLFGNATDTNVGPFVSGDYVETGATGGISNATRTKHLNTGFLTDTLSAGDRHLSAYARTWPNATYDDFIGSEGPAIIQNQFVLGYQNNADKVSFAFGSNTARISSEVISSGANWLGVESSLASGVLYRNGVSAATGTLTSASPPSASIFVFAFNRAATPAAADFFGGTLGSYSIGLSMTATQAADYNTAIQAFHTSLGRNV